MKPSPRTTDPLLAIQALLSSEEPNPIISYDGVLYHIRDAEEKPDKGSFQILTRGQVNEKLVYEDAKSLLKMLTSPQKTFDPLMRVSGWMQSEADTWLASARLAASWEDPSAQIDTALRAISHD
jgi:hypothetical protein